MLGDVRRKVLGQCWDCDGMSNGLGHRKSRCAVGGQEAVLGAVRRKTVRQSFCVLKVGAVLWRH